MSQGDQLWNAESADDVSDETGSEDLQFPDIEGISKRVDESMDSVRSLPQPAGFDGALKDFQVCSAHSWSSSDIDTWVSMVGGPREDWDKHYTCG